MTKKIGFGVLLAGLIGILMVGAIIRTVDKTGQVAEARGSQSGQGYGRVADGAAEGCDEENSGAAQGQGYRAGQGQEPAGDGTGTGQAQVDEWLTLEGIVVSVDGDALVVQTDSGEQVVVENRPWWFAQEGGFSARVGDQVTLVGFYENDDLEVGQIRNVTSGQAVRIREESGRPLWAGRGRRSG